MVEAEEAEARLLAQTLNLLHGSDDLGLKSEQIAHILKAIPREEVLALLPELDSVREAGILLGDLPRLWERAQVKERWRILQAMLEVVYVEPVEEKSIVALRPKPAFRALFQMAEAREGSGVVLYNEKALAESESPEADNHWLWWRRGRVELPVQKAL